MSRFTNVLVVSPLVDGKSWYLRGPFGYAVGSEDSEDVIDVPEGFMTDFASVPRPLWWLFPRWGRYGNAAVIHDYLYWDRSRSRKDSDGIFLQAMRVLEVGVVTRTLLYLAVRIGGWAAWWGSKRRKSKGRDKVAGRAPLKSRETPDDLIGYGEPAGQGTPPPPGPAH